MGATRALARGALAGGAGVTALNTVTYLDMAIRGRPSSSTPQDTVEKASEKAHVPIPGDEDTRGNRVDGLGPLTGVATGVAVGAVMGLARPILGWIPRLPAGIVTAGAAIAASAAPMTALGVTNPKEWSTADWVSDVVPHLAYGLVVVSALDQMSGRRRKKRSRT